MIGNDATDRRGRGMPEFTVYAHGLVAASVCTRLDDVTATGRLNVVLPTGIESDWHIDLEADPTFQGGEPNPCPCPDDDRNRHILFRC